MKKNMTIQCENVNEFESMIISDNLLANNNVSYDITFDDSDMNVKVKQVNEHKFEYVITYQDCTFNGVCNTNDNSCLSHYFKQTNKLREQFRTAKRIDYVKMKNWIHKTTKNLNFCDLETFEYTMNKFCVNESLNITIGEDYIIEIDTTNKDNRFHYNVANYNADLNVKGKMKTDHDWRMIFKILEIQKYNEVNALKLAA